MVMTSTSLSPISGSPSSIKNEIVVASPPQAAQKAPTKSKPRKRVNTAEKRHQHNAIERQRRETLNGKFLSLARLLPSLASHRRPSKSAIVNGSIAHLTHQRDQRLLAAKLLRRVCAERDELFNEVSEWRKANGYPPKEGTSSAWTDEMEEVCTVEKEVFGTFVSMEGDDGDNDDDDVNDMATDQAISFASAVGGHGLVAPRPSNEIDMAHHHALFSNIPVPDKRTTATVNGMTWTHEFPFNPSGSVSSTTSSLPFNAFMSDSVDQSSSGSPANSHQGAVLTPPTTADMNVFAPTHTPSPRSSTAGEDKPQAPGPGHQWTAQQVLFFQQQMQQQQQQLHRSHSQPAPAFHTAATAPFVNAFNSFSQQGASNAVNSNGSGNGNEYAQSLLDTMFPQQANSTIGADQVEQWRKFALGGLMQHGQQGRSDSQPSMAELKNAVRAGMGLGLNMANLWPDNANRPVEGF